MYVHWGIDRLQVREKQKRTELQCNIHRGGVLAPDASNFNVLTFAMVLTACVLGSGKVC
jgi:hypothetical protein